MLYKSLMLIAWIPNQVWDDKQNKACHTCTVGYLTCGHIEEQLHDVIASEPDRVGERGNLDAVSRENFLEIATSLRSSQ